MLKCHEDIKGRQDTDKENAAAVSNEGLKVFKGEPFERAMLCTYLGMLSYMEGDYNNARIFCANADMEDATTEEDMKDYRQDFQIAHYWLGRAYMKLGESDNARIAFRKASARVPRKNEDRELAETQKDQGVARRHRIDMEKQSHKLATSRNPPVAGAVDMSASPPEAELPGTLTENGLSGSPLLLVAASPEQFFTPEFQKDVNLILIIETGLGPFKYPTGPNGCMDAIGRAPYDERKVMVYLDGHKGGCALQLLDVFHQADTRGTSEKDRLQMAKGVTKAVLDQLPYVSHVSQYWNVMADFRYWQLMPGEVHLYAAKVKPGLYTINLQCLDSNGYLLPRYSQTRYFVPVREEQENIYLLHTLPEADNQYVAPQK
jgi:tetratricopeptide (TPR) repeat protein